MSSFTYEFKNAFNSVHFGSMSGKTALSIVYAVFIWFFVKYNLIPNTNTAVFPTVIISCLSLMIFYLIWNREEANENKIIVFVLIIMIIDIIGFLIFAYVRDLKTSRYWWGLIFFIGAMAFFVYTWGGMLKTSEGERTKRIITFIVLIGFGALYIWLIWNELSDLFVALRTISV